MKRLLWIFFLLAGSLPLFAQTPDCVIGFTFNASGQRSTITGCGNNRQLGVIEWEVAYTNVGFSALSLRLESSQNGTVWVTFAGTLNKGINPNTSITHAATDMSGFNSYVSVALNSATGTGTITGVLYGCRQPGCAGSAAAGGSVIPNPLPVDGPTAAGAAPTTPPVLVAGQDGTPGLIRTLKTDSLGELIPSNASAADGDGVSNTQATPTGAAGGTLYLRVFEHVFNGTTWDRLAGDSSGTAPTNASSADSDGVSNTELTPTAVGGGVLYPRTFNRVFNGTTWDRLAGNISGVAIANAALAGADAVSNTVPSPSTVARLQMFERNLPYIYNGLTNDRQFNCPLQAPITFSAASGTLQVVGLVSGQVIYICHVSLSSTVATNITFVYGTGTNCGSGTTSISGAYQQVTSMALDLGSVMAMRTAASNEFCITSSVSATVGGMVSYAQF